MISVLGNLSTLVDSRFHALGALLNGSIGQSHYAHTYALRQCGLYGDKNSINARQGSAIGLRQGFMSYDFHICLHNRVVINIH